MEVSVLLVDMVNCLATFDAERRLCNGLVADLADSQPKRTG